MSLKPRTWFLLSIALFIGAWFFWQRGEDWRSAQPHPAGTNAPTAHASRAAASAKVTVASVVFPSNLIVSETATNLAHPQNAMDYRVSNTSESFDVLAAKNSALLLRNAWIDTASKKALPVPAQLRAVQDPETYIVQSADVITPAFRRQVSEAGATVVSYIPNNAFLVRVAAAGAQKLANSPGVQSVLPYEPFYKLDMELMPEALGQRRNPAGKALRVTVFEGQREAALTGIREVGGVIVGQDKTPFGPQLIVQLPLTKENTVEKLAGMTFVQGIERYHERVLMNDLTRQTVQISSNTVTTANYLGLTGTNVLVNVNDTGVYAGHPDLTNRIFGSATNDSRGHGTHVSGIIASSGANGPTNDFVGTNLVLTLVGSSSNANFRGMAPASSIFILPFDVDFSDNLDSFSSDAGLAETAARSNMFSFGHTNTLISCNSWGYGSSSYNFSAAIFDGAARDALPDVPGSQPVLFIFAAGNRGGASDACFPSELADSISSPATMKNGLSVGATESLRNIDSNVISNVVQKVSSLGTNLDLSYTCNNCTFTTNNDFWSSMTDSSNQVAGFSSRGNTGINSKNFGRFKPDVVAPGSFIISTRPPGTNWNAAEYYNPTNLIDGYKFRNLKLKAGATQEIGIPVAVPDNAVRFSFVATPLAPFTNFLTIYASTNFSPSTDPTSLIGSNSIIVTNITTTNCDGDLWYVDVVNSGNQDVVYDLTARVYATNKGTILTVLSNLNEGLDPSELYRFESGTSMAAPVVSGVAALMQEFFEQRLGRTNSPALMKALLINGARSASSDYNLRIDPTINRQGWGLVNIQNSIPELLDTLTNASEASWPIRLFDQSPTNALSTGQSYTYSVEVTNALAVNAPLRITLVWTDPPGNPAASINLVNDLDLIVTNNDTGEVYFGNNFTGTGDFSEVSMVTSNSVPISSTGMTNDFINNVENVYLSGPLGTNYSVTVVARRVNVNAVTASTNEILQDYALVISTGDTSITNAFNISPAILTINTNPDITILDIGTVDSTNGITGNSSRGTVVEAQRVGANASMLVSTNGTNLQWRFYVVTNATTFTNAVFSVFSAPTLSIAGNISDPFAVPQPLGPNSQLPLGRNISADLDLYVSTNSALTNLDDLAISLSLKSLDRFSDESIVITNSAQGVVYYIGVKSEDQQAGEFSLGVVFLSANPYLRNPDGSVDIELPFARYDIPDGAPGSPGGVMSLPLPGPKNFELAAVTVQDQFTHQRFGDLTGILRHGGKSAYLNNHNGELQGEQTGTVTNTYDDLQFLTNPPLNLITSDGPGDLSQFLGDRASGTWQFLMVDNSPKWTGRVDSVIVTLHPQDTNGLANGTSGKLFSGRINPGQTRYGALTVPATAVSLTLRVAIPSAGEGPLELYVRRDDGSSPRLPGPSNYDYFKTIPEPGASLTISHSDIPPLIAGTYIVAIYCPLTSPTTSFDVYYDMTIDLAETAATNNFSTNITVIQDQAFTNSATSKININLQTNQLVSDVRVGVRIDHPRVSDLVLHLVSPEGTGVLLAENRGHDSTNGFGMGTNVNELAYATFSEDPDLAFIPIKFASSSNFLEFIQPVLVAQNSFEDTTNNPSQARTAGTAAEDRNFVLTGTNAGSVTITYDFFTVPDEMRVYYDGGIIFDTGSVSGGATVTVNYAGASDYLEIVMNEGASTNITTVWTYSFSLNPVPPPSTNKNQRATGVWIVDNNLFVSGITEAAATNGIVARFGLPMQDNALPVWEVNWPDLKGGTRLNGVASGDGKVFVAGDSYTMTTDDKSDGVKQTKGITAAFPALAPVANPADVYGSLWHTQTPGAPGVFTNVGGLEQLHAITTTVEGSNRVIYVTGDAQANSTNFGRLYISKLDTTGIVLWTTNDGSASVTTNYSSGRAITTMKGDIYVAGANADSGVTNPVLARYDAAGNEIWTKVSGFTGEFRGVAAYNNFIFAVGTVTGAGTNSFFIEKFDENGTALWTNQMALNGVEDVLNCVVGYADRLYAAGSTLVAATTNRDAVLLELGQATGALITNATYTGITTYDGGAQKDDIASGIASDGLDLYLVGETHRLTNAADSDVLLLRYRIKNDYIPEEPLSLFTGEYANGDWRLSVWDNRANADVTAGTLLGWQLQLKLAATNHSADLLFHDVPFAGSISGKNPVRYFIVNVPYTASKATISLTNLSGGNLNLWFNQFGLPQPSIATDYLLLSNVLNGVAILDDTTPTIPELLPGQRFYLAVEYAGAGTNDFLIQVTFDNNATTFLTGGGSTSGSMGAGTTPNNLYQFQVSPTDPTMAFQLRNLTGNVDVFMRRGNLASSTSYDFHQSFTGTNFGQIVLQPSVAMPDMSGSWFASIGKLTTNSVAYTVVVTNANRAPVFGSLNTQSVTKGDLLSVTVPVTDPDGAAQQLTFSLGSGAPTGASINTTNGLFSWTPTAAQGPSSNVITINVTDNGVPPITSTRTISIVVNERVPVFAAPSVVSGKLQITWSSLTGQNYEIQTSTNLVNWTTIATNSASGATTTYLDPEPQANKADKFYRIHPVP